MSCSQTWPTKLKTALPVARRIEKPKQTSKSIQTILYMWRAATHKDRSHKYPGCTQVFHLDTRLLHGTGGFTILPVPRIQITVIPHMRGITHHHMVTLAIIATPSLSGTRRQAQFWGLMYQCTVQCIVQGTRWMGTIRITCKTPCHLQVQVQ